MSSEPITPRPPPSLGDSMRGGPPAPHAARPNLHVATTGGGGSETADGEFGTIRSSHAVLAAMNDSLSASRRRHVAHNSSRVSVLREKDQKRTARVDRQHSARMNDISQQLDSLAANNDAIYDHLNELHAEKMSHVMDLKYREVERRREFSSRRHQRISEREAAAEALRDAVYLTPRPNHSPRDVSPPCMSREVAGRLLVLPSPRRNADDSELPPIETSKEALARLQAQREAQVEQQRVLQQQQLEEKKHKRADHLNALKERLDSIVHAAQEENKRRLRKRKDEEDRIASWRWRKQHSLRAEALDRIHHSTAGEHRSGGAALQEETESRPAPDESHDSAQEPTGDVGARGAEAVDDEQPVALDEL